MRLAGRTIGIFVAEGVEDLEYWVTVMRLQEEGARVVSIATDLKPMRGKNGLDIRADALAAEIDPAVLFGLVLPGGWAPDKLRRSPHVLAITRAMEADGKIIGSICHGGSIAISAGIVAGRRVTGSLGIKDDLVNAGAVWVDAPALRDGNQVWGRVVADIPDFCRELIAALAG
jgi:protease I